MLIPYNTDAPLYHAPIATVSTILVNVLLFVPVFLHDDPYDMESRYSAAEYEDWDESDFAEYADEEGLTPEEREDMQLVLEEIRRQGEEARAQQQEKGAARSTTIWRLLTLEFGNFRPWQWLTANYMHADIFHLLGNMFVLWGFGLVVEGKVGWWRFLAIYNLIGIVGWGCVQTIMLFADEGIGLGASLAIFGILVIALVWAPANDMQCVFMLGIRPIAFESSIMSIAIGSVFLQVAISMFHIMTIDSFAVGLLITSEVLHLIGGGLGLAVGIAMLKRNMVDCENWDMFSVWAGKNIKTFEDDRNEVSEQLEKIKSSERKKLAANQESPIFSADDQQQRLTEQFRNLVQAGKPTEAWAVFCRGQQLIPGWTIPEPDFVGYISQLRKQQLWENAAGAMQEYLQRYSERETSIRLALAQVLIQHLNRPREAWAVLGEINGALLSEKDKGPYDKLRAACKQRLLAAKNATT